MSRWIYIAGAVALVGVVIVAQSQLNGREKTADGKPSEAAGPAKPQAAAGKGGGPPAMPPPLVAAATALEKDVHYPQTFVGTVMPKRIADVGSAVDGRVVEFAVN